jgi:hypothetical protein
VAILGLLWRLVIQGGGEADDAGEASERLAMWGTRERDGHVEYGRTGTSGEEQAE